MTTTVREPIANEPFSAAYVRDTFSPQTNGVMLASLGEDGELGVLALGFVATADLRAAVREYVDGEWASYDLDSELEDLECGWTVFMPHIKDCTGLADPDEPDDGPCGCDEFTWFCGEILSDVAEANAKRPNALFVTMWRT